MPSSTPTNDIPILGSIQGEITRILRRLRGARLERRYARWERSTTEQGTTGTERDTPLIVSLTSFPPRLPSLHLVIESLLRQDLQPDRLILWLGDDAPEELLTEALHRQRGRGLEIRYRKDTRSYMKIIPARAEFPDAVLVTADDDTLYPADWLRGLYEAYLAAPDLVHCHRAHQMTWTADGELRPYDDWVWDAPGIQGPRADLFATGCGGVLYPPGALPDTALDQDLFLRLAPTADDVWLKAMTTLAGFEVRKVERHGTLPPGTRGSQKVRLGTLNLGQGGGNDRQIRAVFEHFGITERLRPTTGPAPGGL